MSILLLRLEGPFQSWSTQHDIKERQTGWEPSKSGVIGLLSTALGKPRNPDHPDNQGKPTIAQLAELRMGVRVDRQGTPLRDFHTVGKEGFIRADTSQEAKNVIVTTRWYLADAAFLVALESQDDALLRLLEWHLHHPIWTLYLGRKACVPSAPIGLRENGFHQGGTIETTLLHFPWLGRKQEDYDSIRPTALRIIRDPLHGENGDQTRDDVPLFYDGFRWHYQPRQVITEMKPTPIQRLIELEVNE